MPAVSSEHTEDGGCMHRTRDWRGRARHKIHVGYDGRLGVQHDRALLSSASSSLPKLQYWPGLPKEAGAKEGGLFKGTNWFV